jgi:hypothetical protein
MTRFSIKVETFKPMRTNSRYGFVDIVIPEMRLRIKEATVNVSSGRRWIGLPAKPQIDREGRVITDDRGKRQYVNVLQFADRETSDRFSERVVEALLERFPHAFED